MKARILVAALVAAVIASLVYGTTAQARRWAWPAWWYRQAMCIHRHEAVNWHETRNPADRGGMQIAWGTWRAVGGHGDPAAASVWEQLYRSYRWYRRIGRWGSTAGWPRSSIACGLH